MPVGSSPSVARSARAAPPMIRSRRRQQRAPPRGSWSRAVAARREPVRRRSSAPVWCRPARESVASTSACSSRHAVRSPGASDLCADSVRARPAAARARRGTVEPVDARDDHGVGAAHARQAPWRRERDMRRFDDRCGAADSNLVERMPGTVEHAAKHFAGRGQVAEHDAVERDNRDQPPSWLKSYDHWLSSHWSSLHQFVRSGHA